LNQSGFISFSNLSNKDKKYIKKKTGWLNLKKLYFLAGYGGSHYNPSYSGSRSRRIASSKPAQAKFRRILSQKLK
jgi:hypothetical protein